MSRLDSPLERDRTVVVLGLVAIAGIAWAYTVFLAASMPEMSAESVPGAMVAMPQTHSWGVVDLFMTFIMWTVMMVAMMVPSAAPMVLLFTATSRKRSAGGPPHGRTALFLFGYLLVWTGFSIAATGAQWALHTASLLSPMMVSTSPVLGGSLLAAAGVFQFTPLKSSCLSHCRSPLHFFMGEWKDGAAGALSMGLKHGAYCVGCCWVLMALLFAAGVMNLLWVAVITVFVLVERVAPRGEMIGRITGALLVIAGLVIVGGFLQGP